MPMLTWVVYVLYVCVVFFITQRAVSGIAADEPG
jgi:hypothetical protein